METDIMSAVMLKTGCEDNEMGLINIISDRKNVTTKRARRKYQAAENI